MYVRVLKDWRNFRCGIYADVSGQPLKDGIAEGALDDKVPQPDKAQESKKEAKKTP
jgi:hypothetical protein